MDQMDMMTMNTENLYDSYSEYLMSTIEIHIDDVHEDIRKIREEKIDRILNESQDRDNKRIN